MSSTPTCMDEHDPSALTVEQAIERIDALVRPVSGHERVALRDGLDRVLFEEIRAPFDVPPHRNAAMDGYAVKGAELPTSAPKAFKIIGESFAGHPFNGSVSTDECVRIMTGAVVAHGTDTVIMQEHVQRDGETILVEPGHTPGQNVRQAGEDLRTGQIVLSPGRRLNAADIGLLASLGLAEIDVFRQPVVAFFSTGDELKGIGQTLGVGEIYDSNRYTLYAMLRRLNVEIIDMGVIPDEPEAVKSAFREAARVADLVITSGGVSVGEADYVTETLNDLGSVDFWKIAMKPGRPLAFGTVGEALFFGLPGNPVSVMATFTLFARVALLKLMGAHATPPLRLRAVCESKLSKRAGRKDFQRGILSQNPEGKLTVHTTGLQGSHVLSSMSKANCFIVIPLESGDVEAGTDVEVIPFEGIL